MNDLTGISRTISHDDWDEEERFELTIAELDQCTNIGASPRNSVYGGESSDIELMINTVGVSCTNESKMSVRRVRSTLEFPEPIASFSDFTDYTTITKLCIANVHSWCNLSADDLSVLQLCEGLTNQLFKVQAPGVIPDCVLFRIHGKDVGEFYDIEEESQIFHMLSSYKVAPAVYGSGPGWRIEEWHYAVAVPVSALSNPSIFTQVASHLGRMHKLNRRLDFPLPQGEAYLFRKLRSWGSRAIEICPELARNIPDLVDHFKDIDLLEDWLLSSRETDRTDIQGDGLDVVFAHNDAQENNLLQTPYGLRLIDFEYAGWNYQGFDIGSHWVESALDYTVNSYPFYAVDESNLPSEEMQRLFLSVYLSEFLEKNVMPSDKDIIDTLLKNSRKFMLISHLFWGFWSVIRARQAATYGEFDFLAYAETRLDMYKSSRYMINE